MNLLASENCTTTIISLSSLRLKWSFEILLNWGNGGKVFGHFAFWSLNNISKPKPNRNWLLQSLSGRRNDDGAGMVEMKWGRCRKWIFLVIPKRLCTSRCNPLFSYEYCNHSHCFLIHITLTYFWLWGGGATQFCFEPVSKRESGQFPFSTIQTLAAPVACVCIRHAVWKLPHHCAAQDDCGTR